jgi:putative ABC transport system ATP-binding protein
MVLWAGSAQSAVSPAPGGYQLTTHGLGRTYPGAGGTSVSALSEVNLEIQAGSAVALMGPSGSGKSTLLHLLGGMDRPDVGTIRADKLEITSLSRSNLVRFRRTVGFVFQSFALLPALTARDNVLVPAIPYGAREDEVVRAEQLLASIGLDGREDALPSQLSGGQQQRVAIARALMNRPRLLLADEPTGNLDSTTGRQIIDQVLALREELGITVVMATHDPNIAHRCDRVVSLRDGKVHGT